MSQKIRTRIQNKHDLEINWNNATFIPMAGELIVYDRETDAQGNVKTVTANGATVSALPNGRTAPYTYERFKIGDGVRSVGDLPFADEQAVTAAKAYTDTALSQKAQVKIVTWEADD